ncbi:MAG: hypothetical protein RR651_02175 [Lysinibacillus sp.]
MEYFKFALFGIGVLILIVTLVLLVSKLKNSDGKITLVDISFLFFGLIFIVSGTFLMVTGNIGKEELKVQNGSIEMDSEKDQIEQNSVEVENRNSEASDNATYKTINGFVEAPFKYPIVEGSEEYVDADGTHYSGSSISLPDDTILDTLGFEQSYVLKPIENNNNDNFLYYRGVGYIKGDLSELNEYIYKFPSKPMNVNFYLHPEKETVKSEMYYGMTTSGFEFIKKHMPRQYPNKEKLVNLPFLKGEWVAYEESMLHGKELIMSINFDDDMTFGISNEEIGDDYEELNTFKHFKFEEIDQNIYKLYLYPAYYENDELVINDEEPLKRNFLIYVTSDESIEVVYFDHKLKRKVIQLTRGGVG